MKRLHFSFLLLIFLSLWLLSCRGTAEHSKNQELPLSMENYVPPEGFVVVNIDYDPERPCPVILSDLSGVHKYDAINALEERFQLLITTNKKIAVEFRRLRMKIRCEGLQPIAIEAIEPVDL